MNIRKRTGEVVPFQEEKILNAMKKAICHIPHIHKVISAANG